MVVLLLSSVALLVPLPVVAVLLVCLSLVVMVFSLLPAAVFWNVCHVVCSVVVLRVDVSVVSGISEVLAPASLLALRLLPNVAHWDVLFAIPLCVEDACARIEHTERRSRFLPAMRFQSVVLVPL